MELSDRMRLLGVDCLTAVKGSTLTTFGSGGPVRYLLLPKSEKELIAALAALRDSGISYKVIGGGSNLLLPDEGFDGALIRLSSWEGIDVSKRELIVQAGVRMPRLAALAATCALSGAEFACGIPGYAGGATAGNAGAFGECMADLITRATVITADGRVEDLMPDDFRFDDHRARLPEGAILLRMKLRLVEGDAERISARMREMKERRRATQPREPSAGSVFRKVNGIPAALFIERTGLKGTKVGMAELSSVHCNFIVNRGGATTASYFDLAEKVKGKVKEICGADLVYEVERVCSRMVN